MVPGYASHWHGWFASTQDSRSFCNVQLKEEGTIADIGATDEVAWRRASLGSPVVSRGVACVVRRFEVWHLGLVGRVQRSAV